MNDERNLPSLTAGQMEALRRFARLEITEEQLRISLAGVFEFSFERVPRSSGKTVVRRNAIGHFRMPEPGIIISRDHIAHALDEKRLGHVDEPDLVHWASILLMNDAYVLDPGDEDLIAEWLNDISLNLDPG